MAAALKIGYIWQYEAANISPVSATALHIEAVVRELERRGHQVRLVTLRNGRPFLSDDLKNWRPVTLPEGALTLSRPYRLFESAIRGIQARLRLPFTRLFDSYNFSQACAVAFQGCDLLYERFWMLASGGLMTARKLKVPLFYEVNGDLVEEYTQLGIRLSRVQWWVIYLITHWMFTRAGRVIAVSETLRQRSIERWRLDPTQVITVDNGAQVSLFSQASPRPGLYAQYGLDGEPVVMFVGSFKPWHGIDLLIEAFSHVAREHPQVKLVLVGDGPARSGLESQARQLNLEQRVVFTRSVSHEQVAALLTRAQVAVLNPRHSPASLSQSPLKLFEYMAAGKAIVAPAIPNIQRVLVDRENALLVVPDQPEALAAAISELISNQSLSAALGQAARQRAIEGYSWDRTVTDLETLFSQVLINSSE